MATVKNVDLYDHDSLIKRADGTVPYNGYLWPTEEWRPGYQRQLQGLEGRWSFGVIALADGRWATVGFVYEICRGHDDRGRAVVFATRTAALRASAARMIRGLRAARNWTGDAHISHKLATAAINWSRHEVAVACGTPAPLPIALPAVLPPHSPRPEADLPLFAAVNQEAN